MRPIPAPPAAPIAAAPPQLAPPPTRRRSGLINWANTRPPSSYESLPTGLSPHGYRIAPVTSCLATQLTSFHTPISFLRSAPDLVAELANATSESAPTTVLPFTAIDKAPNLRS